MLVYLRVKSDFDVMELIECTCLMFLRNLFTIHSQQSQNSQTEPLSTLRPCVISFTKDSRGFITPLTQVAYQ